jgi:hypothetical protein
MDSGDGFVVCEALYAPVGEQGVVIQKTNLRKNFCIGLVCISDLKIKRNSNQIARVSSGFVRLRLMKTVMNTQIF